MATSSLVFLSFFLLFSCATCFNITKIFEAYPEFSNFNSHLTQTKLAAEVNKRQTITVLAVANDQMGGLTGSESDVKMIMSLHVVLDYYDLAKLTKLSKGTALLTTLYQSSGVASNQQGFLNVTHLKDGEIAFGSASKGSQLNAKLVKKVTAQPYNISVLQLTTLINPDSWLHTASPPNKAPTPPPSASPKKAPSASPKKAPSPKSPKASPPEAEAPAPVGDSPASEPPAADAPSSSPPLPSADGPAAADAPAPSTKEKSSGSRVSIGACVGIVMVAISSWVAL